MSQKMKELNQTANSECFKFLSFEEGLPQVNVFDDLEGDHLGHMHGVRGGAVGCRWGTALGQVPPILTQDRCILPTLQSLYENY